MQDFRTAVKWWVFGRKNGQLFCYGHRPSEQNAFELGYSVTDFDDNWFEAKGYPTEDMARAKSFYKAEQLEKTGSIGQSLVRIRGMSDGKGKRQGKPRADYYPYDV